MVVHFHGKIRWAVLMPLKLSFSHFHICDFCDFVTLYQIRSATVMEIPNNNNITRYSRTQEQKKNRKIHRNE